MKSYNNLRTKYTFLTKSSKLRVWYNDAHYFVAISFIRYCFFSCVHMELKNFLHM